MPEIKHPIKKNNISPDWLVRGVLTKLGDTFDKLTGRGWKPSSSLATSELIEKLKAIMDLEVKDLGIKGKFVPHNFKLKMQWDKFSTDSEITLTSLQNELLTAAVDHINDNLYHTFAPVQIEVKPDYFTEGVNLIASFDKFGSEQDEIAVKVTVPGMNVKELNLPEVKPQLIEEHFSANFNVNGTTKKVDLHIKTGSRISVGRSRENALSIDDPSVSKMHASLVLSSENKLLVADTGSTNGTYLQNTRISYGKAFPIGDDGIVKFGNVEVYFQHFPKPIQKESEIIPETQNAVFIDGFEFRNKSQTNIEIPPIENQVSEKSESNNNETEQRISFDFEKEEN
ncbi:MAG TPA: FHA domain-containing protein [Pyrinomonadaceae bacterium]|nr:FHA domain-containing protein [Pyrinomonadaceae bacterium]